MSQTSQTTQAALKVALIREVFPGPDAHSGFLAAGATMGQGLSLPLLAAGLYLVLRARRQGGAGETAP